MSMIRSLQRRAGSARRDDPMGLTDAVAVPVSAPRRSQGGCTPSARRAPELQFRGPHFFAGTIPGFVLKYCVGRCVAMGNDRAARYRRLALKEPDKEKAELLRLLADEADRGVLVTTEWLSARPYKKVETSNGQR